MHYKPQAMNKLIGMSDKENRDDEISNNDNMENIQNNSRENLHNNNTDRNNCMRTMLEPIDESLNGPRMMSSTREVRLDHLIGDDVCVMNLNRNHINAELIRLTTPA